MLTTKLISALRARGKNDALAQLAADEIERLSSPAVKEIVLTGDEAEAVLKMQSDANARIAASRASTSRPKKTPSKRVVR